MLNNRIKFGLAISLLCFQSVFCPVLQCNNVSYFARSFALIWQNSAIVELCDVSCWSSIYSITILWSEKSIVPHSDTVMIACNVELGSLPAVQAPTSSGKYFPVGSSYMIPKGRSAEGNDPKKSTTVNTRSM